ncbi:MAG: UDP-N-acetylmuramoyl-L-alanyl-D-glutamate--2,6-diaminopimelate ligase [Vicinamibacterales bacterium]|nr:UDP-N-acetylmuramoyl-L-alanyl-D-glutamate--2,6-diaminopimelate ligase [Vicinamibacterales bacterium]
MTLRDLVAALELRGLRPVAARPSGQADALDRPVAGLAYDSRRASPGTVFIAIRGERFDGAAFAPEAIGRGAIAVVAEGPAVPGRAVPWVQVSDGRLALAVLASAFFGDPSHELEVVGITGTNGKTTTSYLVRGILETSGTPCGLVGTVHYSVGGELFDAPRTTPEALDLQQLFRRMVDSGARACAMEVSSHALALSRVDSTRFAAAVFTNLTQDHLDFHGDMDRYYAAKRRLFTLLSAGAPAVVNLDDDHGRRLATELPTVITYGLHQPADVTPFAVSHSLAGVSFEAITPAGRMTVRSRLTGQFNLYNLLAATATGIALGVPREAIAEGLAAVTAVPGRLQVVSEPSDDVTVIVDYAHTDDALRNVLEAVRPLATGRLVTVFGCGGDRDRSKRPKMGAVAARLSDAVIVTSDNPRSEDPDRIIDDIERGVSGAPGGPVAWVREADRRLAIERAVETARPADVVVIAGKGHEQYQIVGADTLPFDDVRAARAALAGRRARAAAETAR